jgi:hypothetical protein
MSVRENFQLQASSCLPGFLFSFDIADFKRRNIHLGYQRGDADIKEFDAALRALASDSGISARVKGDGWLFLARDNATARVQAFLERFSRTDPITTGWRIDAKRNGESKSNSSVVESTVTRAVRCLCSEVKNDDDVEAALKGFASRPHSLPVNQVVMLKDIPNTPRKPWACVSAYPKTGPDCPFCHGRDFEWEDGDSAVYSGSGTCKSCGAEIDIRQIS